MQIVTPSLDDIRSIQQREERYYWSAAAEILFRGAGYIGAQTSSGAVDGGAPVILTRGVDARIAGDVPADAPQFFEGPLDPATAALFGVSVADWEEPLVEIFRGEEALGLLKYPKELYRDAGNSLFRLSQPSAWLNPTLRGQFIDAPGWEVLAEARSVTGNSGPVLVAHGATLLCGLPVLDIGARLHAFAPLPGRFGGRDDLTGHRQLLQHILDRILAAAEGRMAEPIVRIRRWPAGYRAAFSMRHDYDREISDEAANGLLEFYRAHDIKCSIGFRSDLAPRQRLQAFSADGHEVQFHSHAKEEPEFAAMLRNLNAISPQPIDGMTVHSDGAGIGFLGDTHYGWAERAGLDYVEAFTDHDTPVSPVLRVGADGIPGASRLLALTCDHRLDVGPEAGENRLRELKAELPASLQSNAGFVVVMNHPDLHREQLLELIEALEFDGVWRITQGEAARWFHTTHFAAQAQAASDCLRLRFAGQPAAAAALTIAWPDGKREDVVVPPEQHVEIRRQADMPAAVSVLPADAGPPPEAKLRQAERNFIRNVAKLPLDADSELRELAAAGRQLVLDSGAIDETCGPLCPHLVERWWEWFAAETTFGGVWQRSVPGDAAQLALAKVAPALLIVPPAITDYLKLIGDKSRNMLRKAERAGYAFRPFVTAGYLDDIYAVNTSKDSRQGRPMTEGYLRYPVPFDPEPNGYCARHRIDNFGCFLGDTLVAYCNLVTIGELAVINRIIGHGEHLKNGVMNLLVKGMVEWAIGRYPAVRAFDYLTLDGRSGLDRFKRSVGFQSYVAGLLAADSVVPHAGKEAAIWTDGTPDAADHQGSGFRAAVLRLWLTQRPHVLEFGAAFAGETTTVHLLDLLDARIDIVETDPDRADALQQKFGDAVHIIADGIENFAASEPYDLIVFDLDSNQISFQYEELLPSVARFLKPGGRVIGSIIYDSAEAFNPTGDFLNPLGREDYEGFLQRYFGTVELNPQIARHRLEERGFTLVGMTDKWMGGGSRNAIGWFALEKAAAAEPETSPLQEPPPRIITGLAPAVADHGSSGFRAALKSIDLPANPRVLDVGAGGFLGETTTIHLLSLLDARVDAVEINPDRARALQQKFGDRIRVFSQDFEKFAPGDRYDLIVFDLDSHLIAAQYERFLTVAAKMVKPGGKIINSIIYDSATAYDPEAELLNQAGQADYDAFLRRYFGTTRLTPETIDYRLFSEGFAVLGLIDKWMEDTTKALGWLVLEKVASHPEDTAAPSPPGTQGDVIPDLTPTVPDHRNSGFRAALQCLALPQRPHILDVGAGAFLGAATTAHLLDLPEGRIAAVERDPQSAHDLQQKFGDAITVFAGGFDELNLTDRYDLIVFNLASQLIATQYESFLPKAAEMLKPHGKIISLILYNSATAFAPGAGLNPAGRADYDAFLKRYFGSVALNRRIVERRLSREGFAVLGMIDNMMGQGPGCAAWLMLERLR